MKPQPAPSIPGNSDAERFDNAVRKMFTITKEDLLKEEAMWKREQMKARAKKAATKKPS